MNRAQVEAVLFRFQVAFPAQQRPDPIEAAARIEEWLATDEIAALDPDEAIAGFEAWKLENDRPPTIRQFLEVCRRERNRRIREGHDAEQSALLAEYDETIVPPEKAKENIARVRETIDAIRRHSEEAFSES